MSRLERAAIRYAVERPGGVEWPMLAVSRTKGPLCAHGVHSGTTNPAELRCMWERDPDANPAVRCEAFFVFDLDPRNGGLATLAELSSKYGDMPYTWESETGSGGTHWYFRHDGRIESVPLGKLLPGVDIKGNGKHYVLVPPSRSRSGPYLWRVRPTEARLAKAPEWLIDLILRLKTPPAPTPAPPLDPYDSDQRLRRATAYARALPPAISGQDGHGTTFRAASLIARGFALSEDEAFSVLASEWNPRCEPPWSAAQLRRKIAEALRVGNLTIGALLERKAS